MGVVIFDGIAFGMLLFLMAVGLSVTLGLMNFVNLAHGVFAMTGGYAAAVAMNDFGWGFGAALAASFVVAAGVGLVLEVGLIRRVYRSPPLDQVLLSIGLVFVAVAAFTWAFGPTLQPFQLPASLSGRVALPGIEVSRYRLLLVICGGLLLAALLLLLNRTRYGATVRAAVDNPRVARGLGIDVDRVFRLTFTLGCGLAGLGGALSLGMLGLEPAFALKHLVLFLIVVCVGGAGSVTGSFAAALLIGIVDVAGKYYLPELGAFLIYAVMVIALLLRPHGLFAGQAAGR